MVQRKTPPGSRRMLSTPASMSVKLLSFEKKVFTEGSGALISICVLKEDFTRNMGTIEVRSHAVRGSRPVSSYQQRVHQRCVVARSVAANSADAGKRLTTSHSSSLNSSKRLSRPVPQRGHVDSGLAMSLSLTIITRGFRIYDGKKSGGGEAIHCQRWSQYCERKRPGYVL